MQLCITFRDVFYHVSSFVEIALALYAHSRLLEELNGEITKTSQKDMLGEGISSLKGQRKGKPRLKRRTQKITRLLVGTHNFP